MGIRRSAAIIAVSLPLVLTAACSSSDHGSMAESTSSTAAIDENAAFNAADVTFAQKMIPHHQQAVEMADLVPDRSTSTDLRTLAQQITDAQAPEIEMMSMWLRDWGQEVPSDNDMSMSGHGSSDMEGMSGMDGSDGMMDEAQMAQLQAASGAEFDRLWLEMMIRHHQGALRMAQTEIADGKSPDAIALAKAIVAGQQAEIDMMNSMLAPSAN